ncbi:MAG: lytic transglycosylase domain-containing protein [Telmatospirillum sp.]|nr:lytic transglycosylase domain-containing protein [Telmatospirillum sp.]
MNRRIRFDQWTGLAILGLPLALAACARSDAAVVPPAAIVAEAQSAEPVQVAAAGTSANENGGGDVLLAQAVASLAAGPPTGPIVTAARTIQPIGAPVLNARQRELYTQAFAAIEAGRWEAARTLLARGDHPVANKLFRWLELQLPRSGIAFEDIVQFVDQNPDWPSLETISRRAEEALLDRPSNNTLVLAWFGTRNPLTPDGAMRYADALTASGERERALRVIREHWVSGTFNEVQHKRWLERYRGMLEPQHHAAKLDRLVWDGKAEEARRVFPLVPPERRTLADARLRIRAGGNVEAQAKRVPESLANDPGLLYDRVRAFRRANREAAAREAMRNLPRDLGRPEIWWNERAVLARRSILAGDAAEAYRLARDHRMVQSHGANFLEAEFLAGWIALRRLNDAKGAQAHFERVHEAARFPVSRARGAYWIGRALEAQNQMAAANDWYNRGAALHTTYYGQLAAARSKSPTRPTWPGPILATAEDRQAFARNEAVIAARILLETREKPERVRPFLVRLASVARTPGQHALVAEFAHQLGRNDLAVIVSKRSAQAAGVQLHDLGWPVLPMTGERPERALTYAIIRQESQFEPEVVSSAGARGLMQLMPATARAVAKTENTLGNHTDARLFEPAYNIRLGRSYLASLVDDFGGSYVLAIASYNAGPGRAREWMRNFGDPRQPDVDVVDWIEMIPFEETRGYVQRVMENLQIYRRNIAPTQTAFDIERDLRRRSN